jgi:hypothetical protein
LLKRGSAALKAHTKSTNAQLQSSTITQYIHRLPASSQSLASPNQTPSLKQPLNGQWWLCPCHRCHQCHCWC